MKSSDSDRIPGQRNGDNGLLSLALDCTEMVTELSQGFELERQGDHESALSYLKRVEGQIDGWIDELAEVDTRVVGKEELLRGLREAKEAIDTESFE